MFRALVAFFKAQNSRPVPALLTSVPLCCEMPYPRQRTILRFCCVFQSTKLSSRTSPAHFGAIGLRNVPFTPEDNLDHPMMIGRCSLSKQARSAGADGEMQGDRWKGLVRRRAHVLAPFLFCAFSCAHVKCTHQCCSSGSHFGFTSWLCVWPVCRCSLLPGALWHHAARWSFRMGRL